MKSPAEQDPRRYYELAVKYFENYHVHLQRGEYAKAAEMLWGSLSALANAVNLVKYGKPLRGHGELIKFLHELAPMFEKQVRAAESLHANFYHDFMGISSFQENAGLIISLMEKLSEILKPELGLI